MPFLQLIQTAIAGMALSFPYAMAFSRPLTCEIPAYSLFESARQVGARDDFVRIALENITEEMRRVGSQEMDCWTFLSRSIELSDDFAESGQLRLKQGIGAARYEFLANTRLEPAQEVGVDFVDVRNNSKIQLKGPLLKDDGLPVPDHSQSEAFMGLIDAIIKDDQKGQTNLIVVDLLGLSRYQKYFLKKAVEESFLAKEVVYVE